MNNLHNLPASPMFFLSFMSMKVLRFITVCIFIIVVMAILPIDSIATSEYIQVKHLLLNKGFKTDQKWHVKAFQGNLNETSELDVPAKICFYSDAYSECFEATAIIHGRTYNFQHVKKLSLISLFKSKDSQQKAVLFTSEFSAGGSGSLQLVTIWAFRNEMNKFVNILPSIVITEQGQYRLLSKKEGLEGVFVTADYVKGDNNTHFAPHRYKIKIFIYDNKEQKFIFCNEYITKQVYKSLDDIDIEQINVIAAELAIIKNKIK